MINLDKLKCSDYYEFCSKIREIEEFLGTHESADTLGKITEFIENNRALFANEKQTAFLLDSLGAKVRNLASEHPLISNLQNHIQCLLPSDSQNAKISLQFIRKIYQNPLD